MINFVSNSTMFLLKRLRTHFWNNYESEILIKNLPYPKSFNNLQILIISVSAIVEFDYGANEADELSLVKGDILTNIKTQPGGWWHGVIASTGKSGMFPDNFVKLLEHNHDDKVILR